MLRFRTLPIVILISCFIIYCDAGYTSEETDEKSKSMYSAVTSILGSTDTSKHHHKHTYDSPPCPSAGGCAINIPSGPQPPPCVSPAGCPLTQSTAYSNGIVAPSHISGPARGPPTQVPYGNGVYGNYPSVQPAPQPGTYGYHGQSGAYGYHGQTAGGYGAVGSYGSIPPQTPGGYQQPPYGQVNGNSGPHGYQGDRGYSVLDHSLKTKSEYTETGTHTGPMANNGYGYGSGYGGYMGMYNRPGF